MVTDPKGSRHALFIQLAAEALDGMRAAARWPGSSPLHLTDESLAKIAVDAVWPQVETLCRSLEGEQYSGDCLRDELNSVHNRANDLEYERDRLLRQIYDLERQVEDLRYEADRSQRHHEDDLRRSREGW